MKRYHQALRLSLLALTGILIGILLNWKGHQTYAALPTPTFNPTYPGTGVQQTTRVISNQLTLNRLNGGTCITVGNGAAVKIIVGDNARHSWSAWLDSTSSCTSMRIMAGDCADNANGTAPTSAVGAQVTTSQVAHEEVAPCNRVDAIAVSGSCCVDTSED